MSGLSFGDSTSSRSGVLSKRALETPSLSVFLGRQFEHLGGSSGCHGREDELPEEIVEP